MNDMKKINEGFENIFDSSLIDYSEDFEKSDKDYLKKKIETWIELFLAPYKSTNYKSDLLDYKINEDNSITLNTSFILFENAYSCLNYKLSKSRNWAATIHPEWHYQECPHLWEFFFPYIKKEYPEATDNNISFPLATEVIQRASQYITYDTDINNIHDRVGHRELPDYINIESCYGDFTVKHLTRIKSLRGFPKTIGGSLNIANLHTLSAEHGGTGFRNGPELVKENLTAYNCKFSNEDLEGFPKVMGPVIDLSQNKLTSLNGLPEIIEGDLDINKNCLANLSGTVKYVKGSIDADLQKPDYIELYKTYRSKFNIEDDKQVTDEMLTKIMGPRGIRFFGVDLRFGYNPITDGFWHFEADYSTGSDMPVPKLIKGPENSMMLQGIRWWDVAHKCGKPMRWIKEENKINESFENVFDSSLIDYSNDFEEQDKKQAIINDIKTWVDLCVRANTRDGYGEKVDYKINNDLTIDLINSESHSMNKKAHCFYILPFNQVWLYLPDPSTGKHNLRFTYKDFTDNLGNKLPLDRLPDFINIRSTNGFGFSCNDCKFVTLKGCPTEEVEFYDCTHNDLTKFNLEYLPKKINTYFDCRWQLENKLVENKINVMDFSDLIKLKTTYWQSVGSQNILFNEYLLTERDYTNWYLESEPDYELHTYFWTIQRKIWPNGKEYWIKPGKYEREFD